MGADVSLVREHWTDALNEEVKNRLEEIRKQAPSDFSQGGRGTRFSDEDLQAIVNCAITRLEEDVRAKEISTTADLSASWNAIVTDFYSNGNWGFKKQRELPPALRPKQPKTEAQRLKGYLRTFLVPTLITKSCILYFGLQYSMFPGQGYGYGLIASVSITCGSFAYFVWLATREEESEERPEES